MSPTSVLRLIIVLPVLLSARSYSQTAPPLADHASVSAPAQAQFSSDTRSRSATGIFRAPASQFIEPTTYPTFLPSTSLASADFNGDGKPDIAGAGGVSNFGQIGIYLNNGNGTLTQGTTITAADASFVFTADLNLDGKADLIAADYNSSGIQVLLGNGDGTFQAPVFYATSANPFNVVVGDFNGDGLPDLIVVCFGKTSLLLNQGNGTFGPARSLPIPVEGNMVAGDFDHDGKLDLAVTQGLESNSVTIYLGKGDGSFKRAVSYPTGPNPQAILAGDLNHDGVLDLVIADLGGPFGVPNGDVAVLIGNGDGTFHSAVFYSAGLSPDSPVLGDFQGNGDLGVAVVDSSYQFIFVLFGNGDGTLQTVGASYAARANTVLAADLNGDGKADLVFGGPDNLPMLGTIFNAGGKTFNAVANYVAAAAPLAADLADLNRDGNLDMVSVGQLKNGTGVVSTFLGRGDGTFPPENVHSFSSGGAKPTAVKAVDLNGDGKPDLVVGHNQGAINIFVGNGDGTFSAKGAFGSQIEGPFAVADFNGDGIPDVALLANLGTAVEVFFGNGDASFRAGPVTPIQAAYTIAASDLDLDGKMDLVFNDGNNGFFTAMGNGDGTFAPGSHTIFFADAYISIVLADFNHDGIPDVGYAGVNAYCDVNLNGDLGYVLGNGDGTFGNHYHQVSPYACPGTSLAVGDFNGDGVLDLVEISVEPGLFLGHGIGFRSPTYYLAGFSGPAVVGDVNNDGAPDLVTLDVFALSVLLNASGVHTTITSSPNPSQLGQSVTFTAVVTPSAAFQPVPTGSVVFKDGNKVLATVSLSSGQASFSTSTLTSGKHKISVSYSGDSNFIPGYAASLVQMVN